MNSTQPVISAIVITFNGKEFLPDCLETLTKDLEGIDHELIVVDNGSSDGSLEFVRENFPGATPIDNGRNLGFAKAVNIGIERAGGDYLYILNQDLRFRPGTTRKLLERLQSEPSLGMIGPAYVDFEGRLLKSARAFPSYRHLFYQALFLDHIFPGHREFSGWRMGWFDHLSERYVDQPMGSVMLVPRRAIGDIGMLDESFPLFLNDVDWCRRMDKAGWKRLYFPDAVVEHFVGGSTRRRPVRKRIESYGSMYRYLRKYSRWYERPLLWLCGLMVLFGLAVTIPRDFLRRR